MHWADVEASELPPEPLIATGITPSGPIHLGSLREILTGDAIKRASDSGNLLYIADSIDPLRRVYPFLEDHYEKYVGMPLHTIPCPCGEHESYAAHYLAPFLETIEKLGVVCSVKYTHKMYAEGVYEESTRTLIESKDVVAKIIQGKTGRRLEESWYPYNPICGRCGRLGQGEVLYFEDPFIHYRCKCGYVGKADIRTDHGKLPWRCDWPARWWILDVDCEPLGKDHAAAGGSWDTGAEIIREVFGTPPPHPMVYEWIQLKGKGAMSSSSGIAVKGEEMLAVVEPEVVRFLLMRTKPQSHIDFDPGLPLLDLVEDYDQTEKRYYDGELDEDSRRIYELSQIESIPEYPPTRVPYRHMVNLVQIYDSMDDIWEVSVGGECGPDDYTLLTKRADKVRYWLDNFAPDFVKFSMRKHAPDIELKEKECAFLEKYLSRLEELGRWSDETLHSMVHNIAEEVELPKGRAFGLFYRIFLGQKRGPKLGRFLMQIDRDFVFERLRAYIK
ncbi:MAG: lysine--tRNA ligase [Thermoplasmata archaeon]